MIHGAIKENSSDVPLPKDIAFLNKKLINRSSNRMKNFLVKTMKDYASLKRNIGEFLESQ